MNDDIRLERPVAEMLRAVAPVRAPARLRPDIASVTRSKRQRPTWLANLKEPPMRTPSRVAVGSPTLRLASILGISLALILAVGAAAAVGASLMPSPLPPGETMVPLETITEPDGSGLVPGVTYTSDLFRPRVSFVLDGYGNDPARKDTDWCLGEGSLGDHPATSPRTLVLSWKAGCVWDLRLIRPYAVECGTPDAHPDASALAAAILGNPGMAKARDIGDLSAAASMAPGIDLSGYQGQVLAIEPSRGFAAVPDPDHCRLLPEPGIADPVIEIRGDVNSVLFLVEVDGELVIARMSAGGYDATTGTEAANRGYATGDLAASLPGILATVHDFRFE